jgi:hypothetical protein
VVFQEYALQRINKEIIQPYQPERKERKNKVHQEYPLQQRQRRMEKSSV